MKSTWQQSESKDVKVKILLSGGHDYTLYLKSDAPLLQNLLKALAACSQNLETKLSGLFQIPINEGHSALCFPSKHLIGVVTEPPIIIQNLQPETQPTDVLNSHLQAEPQPIDVIASNYVQIDNLLTLTEKNQLLDYVLSQESAFVSSSTSTNQADYRQSLILHSFPEFSKFMVNRIHAIMPDVIRKLGIPFFSISQIETQLTAHNHNNYYKVHNDNGSPETATRELTYVYYFYCEPKPFSGGELLIYDSKIENNFYVQAESFKKVEPRNNSIVFFPSRYLHEVLPVSCPSQAFADSRFTINGWVRR